jgi:hypothetical protein
MRAREKPDMSPGALWFASMLAEMKVYGHAAFTPSESLREAGAIPFANMMELKSIITQ